MSFVAILLLVLVVVRVVLHVFDSGFGGAAWDAIMVVSSFVWLLAVVLAVDVLLDVSLSVTR